ncbi:MAG TPA: NAD-glutamate dehydrogenase domain-containing protein, partial [Spirochaetia bacterium]
MEESPLVTVIRSIPREDEAAILDLLSAVPSPFPLNPEACRVVAVRAYRCSCLEPRVIVSRMLWLLDPRRKSGVRLLDVFPSLTVDEITAAVIAPRGPVLRLIERTTGLASDFLRALYEEVRTNGAPGDVTQLDELAEERILQEMKWWLTDLSFPEYYLRNTPPSLMARQITLNRSHELAGLDSETYGNMRVSATSSDGVAVHWVHRRRSLEVEEEIERAYYDGAGLVNVTVSAPLTDLLLYSVYTSPCPAGNDTFEEVAPRSFLDMSDEAALDRYEEVWRSVLATSSIVISRSSKEETGEFRVMIGFPRGFLNHFQTNVSRIMTRNSMEITRKYTATFGGSRPVIIASLYARQDYPADLLRQLVEVSLYPPGPVAGLVEKGLLTAAQANFLNAVVTFVHQFITVPDSNVEYLMEKFRSDGELSGVIAALQASIDRDTFPRAVVERLFVERPDIARLLWDLFAARFDPAATGRAAAVADARARLDDALSSRQLGVDEQHVVRWAVRFVDCVTRTNFFLPLKTALAFRLDPSFLAGRGRDGAPYGVFLVVGRGFRGYHVRFKDIARGGIRIVRSPTVDDWLRNDDTLFDECYNLAATQNRKNKDIPEGGAKGIILPAAGASDADAEQAFKRYVDALLDLLLSAGAGSIVGADEEILFLGPDEGTAGLMDWASQRALERGCPWGKAFTTGKDATLGGISHKEHGMTTRGVHRYVLGILGKLGVDETAVTKAQTGGPDGDLGSNEILCSRDRTTVVIDGGGVLHDPDGLDRDELTRLARAGVDSSHFNEALLGPRGFKVRVGERGRRLPDGTVVTSGMGFRNTFHLDPRMKADLFVPCGGRPRSITITNWRSLLDENGAPIFRWIVEGANLFITQEARLKLEEKGVILFKDSSTNKGGVISSSLEVLAALALTDAQYRELMVVAPGRPQPDFRARYIREVTEIICRRADEELELLWSAHEATGTALSILSDTLSTKINEITLAVERSELFDDEAVRRRAFLRFVPPALLDAVGMEEILRRLPESYQRAAFARSVAG